MALANKPQGRLFQIISGRPAIFSSVGAQSQHHSVFFTEKATFAGVQTEDWGQFLHICDIINTANDGWVQSVALASASDKRHQSHGVLSLANTLLFLLKESLHPPTPLRWCPLPLDDTSGWNIRRAACFSMCSVWESIFIFLLFTLSWVVSNFGSNSLFFKKNN